MITVKINGKDVKGEDITHEYLKDMFEKGDLPKAMLLTQILQALDRMMSQQGAVFVLFAPQGIAMKPLTGNDLLEMYSQVLMETVIHYMEKHQDPKQPLLLPPVEDGEKKEED